MSEDERVVFFISAALAALSWGAFLWHSLRIGQRFHQSRACPPVYGSLLAGLGIMALTLTCYAADDVRNDGRYILFYTVLGMAWLGLIFPAMSLLGLSHRDDVLERGNFAAAWAVAGAFLGLTLCYAGGNIGNGPGWWVVIFSAGLATASFFLLWLILAQGSGLADTITIDRDLAAGIRAGGFFLGTGLLLGNAVAGDWHSAAETLTDFLKLGWPSLLLLAIVVYLERQITPRTDRDIYSVLLYGALPGGLYVILGLGGLMIRSS